MKSKLLIILGLTGLLSACGTTTLPVNQSFPSAPAVLLEECRDLQQLAQGTTKLSEVLIVINQNYALYHECQEKNSSWIEWYNTQKKIFESNK